MKLSVPPQGHRSIIEGPTRRHPPLLNGRPLDGHMDENILNAGLDFAMAFGEDWLQPIQTRLAAHFPSLSRAELDTYNATCREAMFFAHEQVVLKIREAHKPKSTRAQPAVYSCPWKPRSSTNAGSFKALLKAAPARC
jgi:hypothetical protein